jgi:hypothetical protein
MGVSIFLRPGTNLRPTGELINITPGLRSQCAAALRQLYGEFPIEFHLGDYDDLKRLAWAASVYAFDDDNVWLKLAMAVEGSGVVTLFADY